MATNHPRPMLYIAGPYTTPDPVLNTRAACQVGTVVYETTEWVPFVPHLTLMWHYATPRGLEFWYDLDLHHLSRCDAIVRLPGKSSGADRELEFAIEQGIQVLPFEQLPPVAQHLWEHRGRI